MSTDEYWMQRALKLAQRAADAGEVPVGAVMVKAGESIAEAWNQPIASHDPCAHAEMLALRTAAQNLCNYRLPGTTLYVTLEPCVMCAGALIHARIQRVVFGAYDFKTGAAGSMFNILGDQRHNHLVEYRGGVLKEDCGDLLSTFFANKRKYSK